jgi:hypothetical protein
MYFPRILEFGPASEFRGEGVQPPLGTPLVEVRMPQPHDAAATTLRPGATLMSVTFKNQSH